MAQDRSTALVRAGLIGLAAGLLLAALALVYAAFHTRQVDCEPLSAQECAFAQDVASELSRTQALGAAGLAALGGGIALWLRSKRGS